MKLSGHMARFSKILPFSMRRYDVIAYIFILLSCFLLFQQADLYHTTASSYAYLNGHILDFYDYNKPIFRRNDYLPALYLIFSIWNSPLKLLGLITDVATHNYMQLTLVELVWAKLLLVLFFFATAIVTCKIAMAITVQHRHQDKSPAVIFASAPIAVFAVFIFGQYDIIGLFFTMMGFYYYIRKDLNRFAWFFSVAISFKYFPLVIFIPLLLLAEKRIIQLIKLSAMALSFTAIQIALYWGNEAFRQGLLVVPEGKASKFSALGFSFYNYEIYLAIIYILICLFAFIKKPKEQNELCKIAVFTSIAAYGVMFSAVVWHPQWLIITTPFFALSYLYIKNKNKSYFIDFVGMLAFIWWVVDCWPHNVDSSMLSLGIFRDFFLKMPLVNADIMPASIFPVFRAIFYIYLFSPLLVLLFQQYGNKRETNVVAINWPFRLRFVLGLAVFVLPALFCAFIPLSIAMKINPLAFVEYLKPGIPIASSEQTPVGEIFGDNIVSQTFTAEHNKLNTIAIKLGTYARHNNSAIKFVLLSNTGTEIATQTINTEILHDNAFYYFRVPTIKQSKGIRYQINISSFDGKTGNAITAWRSKADIYPSGYLTVNNIRISGDLIMQLFYDY